MDAESIDTCSEILNDSLEVMGAERQNILRIRLSLEEALLRLKNHFGEDQEFRLRIGRQFSRNFVSIEVEGEIFNPLSKTEVELEDWSGSLLTTVGLYPLYSYSSGKNKLKLNIPVRRMNSALKILIAIFIGVVLGYILQHGLSPVTHTMLDHHFFEPLFDFWIRILNVLSGPVIFAMVCTAVLNTGTIVEEGGDSRMVVMRYFNLSLVAGVLAVFTTTLDGRMVLEVGRTMGVKPVDYFDSILKAMPNDIITPLMYANTPQILVLAIILGNVVVISGASVVAGFIKHANTVGLYLVETVSRFVPYFTAAFITWEMMMGKSNIFRGIPIILAGSLITSLVFMGVTFVYVTKKKGIDGKNLFRILWDPFLIALRTGGLDEGYGLMENSCVRKLGIEKHFAKVSLPFGLTLYMPINVIGTLLFTIYVSVIYEVDITYGWLLIAIVLSVFLFVATPPVPGANLLAYIVIFSQLGVPAEALIDAMIFDIVFGIFASAGNQMLVQLDLMTQADKIGLLDKNIKGLYKDNGVKDA